jgi:GDPmannose 4,6-dehydratase
VSFELPEFTADVIAVGSLRILEVLRMTGLNARSYQASSSEMSGSAPPPKNEQTPFHTRSPYGISKVFAYWTTVNYREAYGIFAGNGILLNHKTEYA